VFWGGHDFSRADKAFVPCSPSGCFSREEFALTNGTTEQAAEELDSVTSAAKAFTDSRTFTAALKALRHPKPEFFRSL
jgi:hypothetical protein